MFRSSLKVILKMNFFRTFNSQKNNIITGISLMLSHVHGHNILHALITIERNNDFSIIWKQQKKSSRVIENR